MATSYKAVFTGTERALDAAGGLLMEAMHPPAGAISLTPIAPDDPDSLWRLEAYFTEPPDAIGLAAAVAPCGVGAPAMEPVPDIDWVAHALQGLGIVEAGRFLLYGSHDRARVDDRPGSIAIEIDANQAFGTGHHPTTAGCLRLLDRLAGTPPHAVLDLGCGSGVLAIAAAKLWRVDVLASDVDPVSAAIAAANAAKNGVEGRVRTILADGFQSPAIRAAAPFDFVFANILADPLVALAPAMAAHAARRGRVMLAGLMRAQEDGVRAAYAAAGFRLLNRLDHPDWPVLLFVRL